VIVHTALDVGAAGKEKGKEGGEGSRWSPLLSGVEGEAERRKEEAGGRRVRACLILIRLRPRKKRKKRQGGGKKGGKRPSGVLPYVVRIALGGREKSVRGKGGEGKDKATQLDWILLYFFRSPVPTSSLRDKKEKEGKKVLEKEGRKRGEKGKQGRFCALHSLISISVEECFGSARTGGKKEKRKKKAYVRVGRREEGREAASPTASASSHFSHSPWPDPPQ